MRLSWINHLDGKDDFACLVQMVGPGPFYDLRLSTIHDA